MTNTARLIQNVDGQLIVSTFEIDNLIAAMEIRGFKCVGFNNNPRQRVELQHQPKFAGVNGPMWDGDAIRYEDAASYEQLSA